MIIKALLNTVCAINERIIDEKYGGEYMYEYKFSSLGEDKEDGRKDLLLKLNKIDKSFDLIELPTLDANKTLGLTKLDYNNKTKEEIAKEAIDSLALQKSSTLRSIESSDKSARAKLNEDINDTMNQSDLAKEEKSNSIKKNKEMAQNSAIKNGIARSSILINKIEALSNEEIDFYNQIDKDLTNKLNKYTNQLDILSYELDVALNNFEVEYAVKLNDKISKIEEELIKNQQQVTKYNNEIALKESKYQNELIDEYNKQLSQTKETNNQIATTISKYGLSGVKAKIDNQKYETALEYFKNMDKETALMELSKDSVMLNILGKTYYNKLYDEISAK